MNIIAKMNKYKIHIFEIDKGSRKVYVQYTSKPLGECFKRFKGKVKKGNNPVVLTDYCNASPEYINSTEAKKAATALCDNLDQIGYEVIAGTVLQNSFYNIYVIELNDDPKVVYVGQTKYDPDIRMVQHRIGYNYASKHVRKADRVKLRPDLYEHLPHPMSQDEAKLLEAQTADKLRAEGYTVYGGH